MINIEKLNEVFESLKRKKSSITEAERLGISINDYNYYKHLIQSSRVLNEDDDKNFILTKALDHVQLPDAESSEMVDLVNERKKLQAVVNEAPKSPEEIIKLLNIDTTEWMLSQYWIKERESKYYISAFVTKKKQTQVTIQESFLEELKKLQFEPHIPIKKAFIKPGLETVAAVMSLQDIHFGKVNNDEIHEILYKTVKYLSEKALMCYNVERLFLVLGPDTLNMDTFLGTTSKGTFLENSTDPMKTYLKAFNVLRDVIHELTGYFPQVEVIFISGNHDRLSSFHLIHALSQCFARTSGITFDIEYDDRKVKQYGQNMICFEHGDVVAKNNPLVYATEYPQVWGNTRYRYLYTGHLHGRKTKEFYTENETHGFVTRVLPALCETDNWHYHNKYVGNKRSAIIHIHDEFKGLIGEFSYNV